MEEGANVFLKTQISRLTFENKNKKRIVHENEKYIMQSDQVFLVENK